MFADCGNSTETENIKKLTITEMKQETREKSLMHIRLHSSLDWTILSSTEKMRIKSHGTLIDALYTRYETPNMTSIH